MTKQTPEQVLVAWRERLDQAHRQMHNGMEELITKKDYAAAEAELLIADKMMLDLIEDANGLVVRTGE